jgi:hypothetical protein
MLAGMAKTATTSAARMIAPVNREVTAIFPFQTGLVKRQPWVPICGHFVALCLILAPIVPRFVKCCNRLCGMGLILYRKWQQCVARLNQ